MAAGLLTVLEEEQDKQGSLKKVKVESVRYVESDTALVNRVLGREVGGKQNILVFNDEAHHAYRIRREEPEEGRRGRSGEEEEAEEFFQGSHGLGRWPRPDPQAARHQLLRGPVGHAVFLGRVGQETNQPFPWVVSDFGLIDAIESGLVKIPQLAVRDTTGAEIPGYFNIWHWILPQAHPGRARRQAGEPEARGDSEVGQHADRDAGGSVGGDARGVGSRRQGRSAPAGVHPGLQEHRDCQGGLRVAGGGQGAAGIPPAKIEGFRNSDGRMNTIRVDSKVVQETDTGEAKSDESRWMRFTLDTVGKIGWPMDRQGRPIYPEGFEELAEKLDGRFIRRAATCAASSASAC